jgi:hypothetical protein
MTRPLTACLALATSLIALNVQADEAIRVRGTILSLEGNVLMVRAREGRDVRIELAPNAGFAYVRNVPIESVKPGTPLGTAAMKGRDGKLVALELHLFPVDQPIPAEGHRPWDLEPGSTMTNARVSALSQATGGREITLSYPGGAQQVVVPANIPVVETVPADRSVARPGEYVVVNAMLADDGRISAPRVLVSRDGVRPPQ